MLTDAQKVFLECVAEVCHPFMDICIKRACWMCSSLDGDPEPLDHMCPRGDQNPFAARGIVIELACVVPEKDVIRLFAYKANERLLDRRSIVFVIGGAPMDRLRSDENMQKELMKILFPAVTEPEDPVQ